MKIFISWSGRRSHEVAEALGPWLKKVIQSTDYWLSSDMERGVKWMAKLGESLDRHSLGILCVTPGNQDQPWLNFEAGALSKHLGDDGRVIPYLLDFRSANELKGPLSQFNVALADADGTWQLVKTLNAHSEFPQTEQDLRQTFDVWWPKLEQSLAAVRGSVTQSSARRSSDDKIDEILGLVRAQQNAVRVIRGEPVGRRYLVMPRRVQGRPTEYHLQEGLRVLNISHRAWEVFVRPASSRAFPDADLFDLFENQPEVDESERLAQQAELDGAMQAWEDAGRPGEQDDEDVGGDDTDGTGFHAVERR